MLVYTTIYVSIYHNSTAFLVYTLHYVRNAIVSFLFVNVYVDRWRLCQRPAPGWNSRWLWLSTQLHPDAQHYRSTQTPSITAPPRRPALPLHPGAQHYRSTKAPSITAPPRRPILQLHPDAQHYRSTQAPMQHYRSTRHPALPLHPGAQHYRSTQAPIITAPPRRPALPLHPGAEYSHTAADDSHLIKSLSVVLLTIKSLQVNLTVSRHCGTLALRSKSRVLDAAIRPFAE